MPDLNTEHGVLKADYLYRVPPPPWRLSHAPVFPQPPWIETHGYHIGRAYGTYGRGRVAAFSAPHMPDLNIEHAVLNVDYLYRVPPPPWRLSHAPVFPQPPWIETHGYNIGRAYGTYGRGRVATFSAPHMPDLNIAHGVLNDDYLYTRPWFVANEPIFNV